MSALRNAVALVTMGATKGRDASNVLRTFQNVSFRDAANVLRGVFTSMSASATPSAVSGTRGTFGPGSITVTSNAATASPSGGVAPFSYDWDRISGAAIVANAAAAVTTTFSKSCALDEEAMAAFVCMITDASGATASAAVSVTLQHVNLN